MGTILAGTRYSDPVVLGVRGVKRIFERTTINGLELRNRLVPVNRKIGLDEVFRSADRYFEVSGRRLTFEYVLLAEKNDQPQHALELARLLRGRTALLNLIPYNRVSGLPYETPSERSCQRFCETLEQRGITVLLRRRKGDQINAACGQLRRTEAG